MKEPTTSIVNVVAENTQTTSLQHAPTIATYATTYLLHHCFLIAISIQSSLPLQFLVLMEFSLIWNFDYFNKSRFVTFTLIFMTTIRSGILEMMNLFQLLMHLRKIISDQSTGTLNPNLSFGEWVCFQAKLTLRTNCLGTLGSSIDDEFVVQSKLWLPLMPQTIIDRSDIFIQVIML
ncbi:unnamed protein product [Lactuca virosa]|uniref:Uncharacterized protein n=1 Tax=Lactuca virosa TaxID=75947 RepID=A0AAU9M2K8_9ASTR|nr:unnamed protein product [Lactuca virosa]